MAEMSRLEKWFVNRRGVRAYRRMLDRIERAGQLALQNASQVLELGAGNGALSITIYERFHPARMCVTDYDTEQVELARGNIGTRFGGVPGSFVIERGDATHLAYADRTFDLVMAHQVLHHLGDVPAIFRGLDEIKRVLRPGGRLLYAEIFHKDPIRAHLVEQGFALAFRERRWRLFNTADVIVAISPSAPPNTS